MDQYRRPAAAHSAMIRDPPNRSRMPKQTKPRRRQPVKRHSGNLRSILIGAAAGLGVSAALMLVWLSWGGPEPGPPTAAPAPARETASLPAFKPALPEPMAAPAAPSQAPAAPPQALPPPAEKPPAAASLPAAPPRAALPGEPAWRRNAVAVAPAPSGTPRIAIVIDDLGPNHRGSQAMISLPAPLTLAFLPYAGDLARLVAEARRNGHEILVHMPMEPMNASVDPGPDALRVLLPKDELRRRIEQGLTRFPGPVGLNNHMGSRFTANPKAMVVLMDEVAGRGMLFLDSRTTVDTVAEAAAKAHGVPFVSRDVFLDNNQSADAVEQQLLETERVARQKGHAVAIGHPHPATRTALAAWLPQAARRGFQLVPISSLARVAPVEQARRR